MMRMHALPITYLGDDSILTNPLYLKWSQNNLTAIKAGLAPLKVDLGNVEANMDNLNIIAYLSTLIRIGSMI